MANIDVTQVTLNSSPADDVSLLAVNGLEIQRVPVSSIKTNSSGSGSGGGASIIYANELPSTPQQAIYVITQNEVVKAELATEYEVLPLPNYAEIVDVLPETGNAFVDLTTQDCYMYYLTTDGVVYGYIDDLLEQESGMPKGWLNLVEVGQCIVVNSIEELAGTGIVGCLITTEPKTRVYVPMQDSTFLELTSGIRTRFDENSGTVSITEM